MTIPGDIRIEDFNYALPDERIAQFPLEQRDSSRVLIWEDGKIGETLFSQVDQYIPANSLLVFNDTKVVRARLIFTKETGATIEIFCLEPVLPTAEIQGAFRQTGRCTWTCLVGNAKRWKDEVLHKEIRHDNEMFLLHALKQEDLGDGHFLVQLDWEPASLTFSEILEISGRIPLPPYINRSDSPMDSQRYQTIYAKHEGSVAAPTAGLHFTEEVMKKLQQKNITFEKLALHVGVGTFRPVSSPTLSGHIMHSEKVIVTVDTIHNLIGHIGNPVVAVGTTSVRTLESLYWSGVKILTGNTDQVSHIHQWDPYDEKYSHPFSAGEALKALEAYLHKHNEAAYSGTTQLLIVPGYRYRMVDAMITNFHLPQSTLLLLVAAFIGDDWKQVYGYALENNFRFLSYGDACLFFSA